MPISKELKNEIRTMYREGVRQEKLCTIFGVSRSSVCRVVKGSTRDLRDDKIRKLWREGETVEQIMRITGLKRCTVRKVTKGIKNGRWIRTPICEYCGDEFKQDRYKNSLYCRLECKRKAVARKLSDEKHERNEEIRKLRAEGMTLQAIGDKYGLSRQRVFLIVRIDETRPI
jgi:DNA invertase Pin-like site-specific DNA recombinase